MASSSRTTSSVSTEIRQRMLTNGFTPVPNREKQCKLKGWPRMTVTPEAIASWETECAWLPDTGMRLDGELVAIDWDINDPIIDHLVNAAYEQVPALADKSQGETLVRYGKGHKEAWFLRCSEPFGRLHTRKWLKPGTALDEGTACLEIFGSAHSRQFGAFGAHTRSPAGAVVIAYSWADGLDPTNTPLEALQVVVKSDLHRLINLVEDGLRLAGWQPVALSQSGEDVVTRVYDIPLETLFVCDDGVIRNVAEAIRDAGDEIRCSASFLEGPSATNTSRCLIGLTSTGDLCVWESSAAVTHMLVSSAPRDYGPEMDRMAERLLEIAEKTRLQLSTGDPVLMTATKLRGLYAYCATQRNQVVPIWATTLNDGMPMTNFRQDMLKYAESEVGPRGGVQMVNPADVWLRDEARVSVAGLAFRPDMPRPMFEGEDGCIWINTYNPPIRVDAAAGNAQLGVDLIDGLLPDERERAWFWQWLAFKYRHPWMPGPAVLMVARSFGTGRGTLGKLMAALFGRRYVASLDFSDFTGSTYQAQYNEWAATTLMVLVNESAETGGHHSAYAAKTDAYEHLKALIDPSVTERLIKRKGINNYYAKSFTTYLIATNHVDALRIPIDDRRIAVLSNGDVRGATFWTAMQAWLEVPANIAAFGEYLEALDISSYSPYAPPLMTEAKADMVDAGETDLDRAFAEAVASMVSEVFTVQQIEDRIRAETGGGFDLPQRWAMSLLPRLVRKGLYRVGERDGVNWQIKIETRKHGVYTADPRAVKKWSKSNVLREEVLKNGQRDAKIIPLKPR